MKVLILGATGFIGNPMAQAFTRAGHTVIGQTRSKKSAISLAADEIIPLVAEPSDVAAWRHVVKDVDCVIEAIGGESISELCKTVFDVVKEEAEKSRPNGPPLSYIYCSGTWVHGDHLQEAYGSTSDRAPITDPMPITSWRLDHERRALSLQSPSIVVNVVRPSLLYGKSGSITAMWFDLARKGDLVIQSNHGGKARIATIHGDDLAEVFVLVAEKSPVVKGVIFEGSGNYPENLGNIMDRLAEVSGAKGPTYTKSEDALHEAIASSNLLRPDLARSLLGWQPRKVPLAEGMEIYYHSWLASIGEVDSKL